jgi:hypothetical protein
MLKNEVGVPSLRLDVAPEVEEIAEEVHGLFRPERLSSSLSSPHRSIGSCPPDPEVPAADKSSLKNTLMRH